MVAVKIRGYAIGRDAKFAREPNAFVTTGTGITREVLLGNRGVRVLVRFNGVDAVTICANGRELIAARDGLSVNAGVEGVLNVRVALSARGRDIEFVDRRLGIGGREDRVRAVAIGAHGGFHGSVLDGTTVHAVLV